MKKDEEKGMQWGRASVCVQGEGVEGWEGRARYATFATLPPGKVGGGAA